MTQSEQVEWFRYPEVETFVTDRLDQFVANERIEYDFSRRQMTVTVGIMEQRVTVIPIESLRGL